MHSLSQRQLWTLIFLTIVWGLNWPVMKLGVTDYPPLTFRVISIWLGLPILAMGLVFSGVSFRIPRAQWRELLLLAATNMLVWHVVVIIALKQLTSGRAAILGYTMPIFSAILGALWFNAALPARAWAGVAAAGLGVLLLLWHEFTNLAGAPLAVAMVLLAAAVWALGTNLLRRTTMTVPTMAISFWMTVMSGTLMVTLSVLFERHEWKAPTADGWFAIAYNSVLIFGFAQAAWFSLARGLPPVASTLSVMFIPVLGVFSGAWWLGEVLHWQDWAAVALIVLAIASVLWPTRQAVPET